MEAPVPSARRHIGKLFWVGVAIAPIAALLLALGSGVGPLRAAAALAILSVVIIGLSVVLRDDAAMVKDDVEDQLRSEVDGLRAEIDALRRGVEVSVHRELERVHHELEATRRETVIRAESSRINNNRLTGGALPPAEDEYAAERQRRGATANGRRAITARADAEAQAVAAASGEDGYNWFGEAESPEPVRYEAGTYGGGATTYGAPRPENTPRAENTSDSGRRRRPGNTYGGADAVAGTAKPPGAAKPAGTEYGSAMPAGTAKPAGTEYGSRREGTTYGSGGPVEPPEEQSGRRRRGHRRAEEEHSSFEAPAYQAADYEVVGYDDAPPVYNGAGEYRGSRATRPSENNGHEDVGTVDYTEFWARSASPPAQRDGADQDAGAEWSSWRGNDVGRYDRDDPQVITGAITGAIYDVPYTVGGQSLSEPQFGAGNGFGAGGGFGAGNGFGGPEQGFGQNGQNNGYGEPRWDDPPPASWAPASSAHVADQGPAPEFELPNLDHLPAADGSAPEPSPENTGGRHASADQRREGRYRSW